MRPLVVNIYIFSISCRKVFREIGGEVSTDGDFLTFEGNQYRRGFLYKWFPLNVIVSF